MIRAAFFDIDGTLLSFRTHSVSEGTIRAFHRLHRAGVRTFIASGRPMVLIPPMPVGFEGYITMNGGLTQVVDGERKTENGEPFDSATLRPCDLTTLRPHDSQKSTLKTLYANPIPQEDTERWIDHCQRHGICTMLFTANGMMAANINEVGLRLRDALGFSMPPVVDISQLHGHEAYQLIAIIPPEADAEVSALMPHCRLPRWSPVFTDIVSSGNSKAVGMEAVCRHFGIRREETIAFGDGGNDVEMLRWAGIGIAMGNANDDVKAQADLVTADVDHEGIEQAVARLL